MAIANYIYDLLIKEDGVSFRIYHWPSTCPLLQKVDSLTKGQVQNVLQSIVVGFIDASKHNGDADLVNKMTVAPGTKLYMEAFSIGKSPL